jgi:hypothetical protein
VDEHYDLVVIRSSQGGEPPVSMEGDGVVREMDALQELRSTVFALRRISFFRFLTDPDLSQVSRIRQRHTGLRRSLAWSPVQCSPQPPSTGR